jgi:hypothetical protein
MVKHLFMYQATTDGVGQLRAAYASYLRSRNRFFPRCVSVSRVYLYMIFFHQNGCKLIVCSMLPHPGARVRMLPHRGSKRAQSTLDPQRSALAVGPHRPRRRSCRPEYRPHRRLLPTHILCATPDLLLKHLRCSSYKIQNKTNETLKTSI